MILSVWWRLVRREGLASIFGSLLGWLDVNEHSSIARPELNEVGAALTEGHLVAKRSLVRAIADEGIVFPEADRADQTYAAFRERDVPAARALLTRCRILGGVPGQLSVSSGLSSREPTRARLWRLLHYLTFRAKSAPG